MHDLDKVRILDFKSSTVANNDEGGAELSDLTDHEVPEYLVDEVGFRNVNIVFVVLRNKIGEIIIE